MKKIFVSGIIRNIFSVSFGRFFSQIINLVALVIAARNLGAESFGIFSGILSIVIILSKIVDFGLSNIVFRESSKEPNNFSFINNSLVIRTTLAISVILIYNIFTIPLDSSAKEIILINILFINIFISSRFTAIRELLEITFKVKLKMHFVMIFNVLDNIIFLILIVIFSVSKIKLEIFVVLYVVTNLPGFFLLVFWLIKSENYKFRIITKHTKFLIKEALPLLGYTILLNVFLQIDILYLKYFDSNISAGLYSVATRLTAPLNIIPIAIVTTIYPKIVQNFNNNIIDPNIRIINLVFKILFLVSFFSAVLFTFKAKFIINFLFGMEFKSADLPTIFLFWSYLFMYFNYFSLDILVAKNKQKINFIYSVLINISLFIFIPFLVSKYTFTGMAISKLLATMLGSVFIYLFLSKYRLFRITINLKFVGYMCFILVCSYFLQYINIVLFFVIILIISLVSILIFNIFNDQEKDIFNKLLGDRVFNETK